MGKRSRCFHRDFTKEDKWLVSSEWRLSLDSSKAIQMKPVMGQPYTLTTTMITEKFPKESIYREMRCLRLFGTQNDTVTLEN